MSTTVNHIISTYINYVNHINHINHIHHIHHINHINHFTCLDLLSPSKNPKSRPNVAQRQVPESWRILLAARAVELELEAELEPLEALALPPAVEDEEATEVVDVIDMEHGDVFW